MLTARRPGAVALLSVMVLASGCGVFDESDRIQAAEVVFDAIEFAGAHEVEGKEETNSGLLYDVTVDGSFTPADLTMPPGFVEGPLDDQVDFIGPDPVQQDLECIVTIGIPENLDVERVVSFDIACAVHDLFDESTD